MASVALDTSPVESPYRPDRDLVLSLATRDADRFPPVVKAQLIDTLSSDDFTRDRLQAAFKDHSTLLPLVDSLSPEAAATFLQSLLNILSSHLESTSASYYNLLQNLKQHGKLDLIENADNYEEDAVGHLDAVLRRQYRSFDLMSRSWNRCARFAAAMDHLIKTNRPSLFKDLAPIRLRCGDFHYVVQQLVMLIHARLVLRRSGQGINPIYEHFIGPTSQDVQKLAKAYVDGDPPAVRMLTLEELTTVGASFDSTTGFLVPEIAPHEPVFEASRRFALTDQPVMTSSSQPSQNRPPISQPPERQSGDDDDDEEASKTARSLPAPSRKRGSSHRDSSLFNKRLSARSCTCTDGSQAAAISKLSPKPSARVLLSFLSKIIGADSYICPKHERSFFDAFGFVPGLTDDDKRTLLALVHLNINLSSAGDTLAGFKASPEFRSYFDTIHNPDMLARACRIPPVITNDPPLVSPSVFLQLRRPGSVLSTLLASSPHSLPNYSAATLDRMELESQLYRYICPPELLDAYRGQMIPNMLFSISQLAHAQNPLTWLLTILRRPDHTYRLAFQPSMAHYFPPSDGRLTHSRFADDFDISDLLNSGVAAEKRITFLALGSGSLTTFPDLSSDHITSALGGKSPRPFLSLSSLLPTVSAFLASEEDPSSAEEINIVSGEAFTVPVFSPIYHRSADSYVLLNSNLTAILDDHDASLETGDDLSAADLAFSVRNLSWHVPEGFRHPFPTPCLRLRHPISAAILGDTSWSDPTVRHAVTTLLAHASADASHPGATQAFLDILTECFRVADSDVAYAFDAFERTSSDMFGDRSFYRIHDRGDGPVPLEPSASISRPALPSLLRTPEANKSLWIPRRDLDCDLLHPFILSRSATLALDPTVARSA